MDDRTARAGRRTAIWAGGLAASLVAHAASADHVAIVPAAPLLWLSLVAVSLPLGLLARDRAFRPWGAPGVLAAVCGAQAVVHLALTAAPWAFGLSAHGHAPLVTPASAAAHLVLALALTGLVLRGQRILARLVAVARAILPAARARRALPRPRVPAPPHLAPPPAAPRRPRTSRGPPPVASPRPATGA